VATTKDDETQCALFLGDGGDLRGGGLGGLALDAAELFGIGEDHVHVLNIC
jgi:hypothetical protein